MDVVINGNTYSAYADLVTANLYLAAQIQAVDWAGATDDQKGSALVTMSRIIDRTRWQGTQTDGYEDHAWPRSGLSYPDGTPVDPNSIPSQIVDACCEGAALLIAGDTFQDTASTFNTTKVLKAGSVMIENFRQIGPQPRFPQIIQELIGLWLGGSTTPRGAVSSGTCGKTIFNETYDVNRGF